MPVQVFLQKTFQMLSDTSCPHIYGWGRGNDSIFIRDIEEFAKVILPKYFKHSNYASFKRQLHKYDFHKTVNDPRHGEFKHKFFVKGRPDLLEHIQRKKYISKVSHPPPPSPSPAPLSPVTTDEETDTTSSRCSMSEKDGFEQDFDLDFLIDGADQLEMDFEQFDEIESSVENGIIAFDNDRISLLEKRQAHLMEENEVTKNEIQETLAENVYIVNAMHSFLDGTMTNSASPARDVPLGITDMEDAEMEDLSKEMTTRCALGAIMPQSTFTPVTENMVEECMFLVFVRRVVAMMKEKANSISKKVRREKTSELM